jgi:hypothetical protein
MPRLRFEPTIPVLQRVKVGHALDRAVIVNGEWRYSSASSLTSAQDGGELRASRSDRFVSVKEPQCSL